MEKHLQIISRADAKRLGMKRYFTGNPCKHGHVAERDAGGGRCFGCILTWNKSQYDAKPIEEHRDRHRKYTEQNRDKVSRNKRLYIAKNRAKVAKWKKNKIDKNPDFYKDQWIRTKENDLALKKARNINRLASEKYRLNHRERRRAVVQACYARRKSAQGHHTSDDIKRLLTEQRHHCAACNADLNKTGYHVDHIQPLAKGGTNWPDNLQILCPPCNLSKGAKDPVEWAQSRGKLL